MNRFILEHVVILLTLHQCYHGILIARACPKLYQRQGEFKFYWKSGTFPETINLRCAGSSTIHLLHEHHSIPRGLECPLSKCFEEDNYCDCCGRLNSTEECKAQFQVDNNTLLKCNGKRRCKYPIQSKDMRGYFQNCSNYNCVFPDDNQMDSMVCYSREIKVEYDCIPGRFQITQWCLTHLPLDLSKEVLQGSIIKILFRPLQLGS